MPRYGTLIIALLFSSLGQKARSEEPDLRATFKHLLPSMGQESAQRKWQEACWKAAAPGHESERLLACELMTEKLGPETPTPARIWLLKQLERIGRDECAAAVAGQLHDKDPLVRDAALRALADNPAPSAGDRLREALKAAKEPAEQLALVNALGFRAEASSCAPLGETLQSDNDAVAAASAAALGRIATPEAAEHLKRSLESKKEPVRRQAGDALARCAAAFLARGDAAAARAIGERLYRPVEPARLAGLETLLKSAGAEAPRMMLGVLARGNPAEAALVVGFVRGLDGHAVKELAGGLPGLGGKSQAALLRAFGERRDRGALPAVVSATASADPTVRSAALAALSGVGDASTVALLVKAVQEGGESAPVARRSLETVFADGVDQALIDTLKTTSDPARRALFIEILDHRRAASAVPVLLQELASDDANLRRRAISALGNVAGPEDASGMIKGLLAIKDAGERAEAGRAVAAVCARAADEARRADPVLTAYDQATAAERSLLVPVLGRIGGAKALVLVREAVASQDEARRQGGFQALFNWPDSAVASDLLKLAETTSDGDLKKRAVQELARVVVQPGPLSADERLALLTRGFDASNRDQEKRLILERIREVHTFPAVRFAAKRMSEPGLAAQAIATVVDLLHHEEIRKPNQSEADAILDQVIRLSKDKSLVERAKSFRSKKP